MIGFSREDVSERKNLVPGVDVQWWVILHRGKLFFIRKHVVLLLLRWERTRSQWRYLNVASGVWWKIPPSERKVWKEKMKKETSGDYDNVDRGKSHKYDFSKSPQVGLKEKSYYNFWINHFHFNESDFCRKYTIQNYHEILCFVCWHTLGYVN